MRAQLKELKASGKRMREEEEDESKLPLTTRIKKRREEGKTFIDLEQGGLEPVRITFNTRKGRRPRTEIIASAKRTVELLESAGVETVSSTLLKSCGYGTVTAKDALAT